MAQETTIPAGGLAQDASATQAAMRIIAQATQPQFPGGLTQNRPQVILPQSRQQKPLDDKAEPVGNVNATTRDGQKRNDLNQLITTVGNVVKTGVNAKREKDEQGLIHNLAIIQAAASNPDDPHNQQILDTMSKDPKVVKQLQKALGYNPLGGEPPPPEFKTLQKFGAQLKAKDAAKQQVGGGTGWNASRYFPRWSYGKFDE